MGIIRRINHPQPEEEDDDDGAPHFAIHHMLLGRHAGTAVGGLIFDCLPPIDAEAITQPINPGMPPLHHASLPRPEAFRPFPPPMVDITPAMAGRSSSLPQQPRPQFPVAEAPTFRRLAPDTAAPAVSPPIAPDLPPFPASQSAPAVPGTIPAPVETAEAAEPSILERFDPIYALLIYLALGLGAMALSDAESRYTILWSYLVVVGSALTLMDTPRRRRGVRSNNLIWGIGVGLLVGLPLALLAAAGLSAASRLLFRYATLPALFQTLVFLAPLGETLFFRGMLQERRGFVASVIGAGLGAVIFYWPAGSGSSIGMVLAISTFLTVLAAIYSYVRERYGLAAAYACQVTLNLLLFFVPRLVAAPKP